MGPEPEIIAGSWNAIWGFVSINNGLGIFFSNLLIELLKTIVRGKLGFSKKPLDGFLNKFGEIELRVFFLHGTWFEVYISKNLDARRF